MLLALEFIFRGHVEVEPTALIKVLILNNWYWYIKVVISNAFPRFEKQFQTTLCELLTYSEAATGDVLWKICS